MPFGLGSGVAEVQILKSDFDAGLFVKNVEICR